MSLATACGGGSSTESGGGGDTAAGTSGSEEGGGGGEGQAGGDQFQLSDSDDAGQAHGDRPSEIEASRTHAAMRLFVVDRDSGPMPGVVIKMTAPDGTAYYTGQTDSVGYAEVLVPVGQRYQIEYLELGRRNTMANVEVPDGPNQDIRLTMRYRRRRPPPLPPEQAAPEAEPEPQGLVLEGILFETGSAIIEAESFPRLDRVVEYMTYMTSVRIRIGGHTDNVGNPRRNQQLSQTRAEAVREYLIQHEIDGSRVEAVGYGDTRPVASNDTEAGRAQNRRIDAEEL
jgi:outer membrane protein OmpA-like peptidoglycan-associated protein